MPVVVFSQRRRPLDQHKYLRDYPGTRSAPVSFIISEGIEPSLGLRNGTVFLSFSVSFSPPLISHLLDPITGPRRLAKQRTPSVTYDRYRDGVSIELPGA